MKGGAIVGGINEGCGCRGMHNFYCLSLLPAINSSCMQASP